MQQRTQALAWLAAGAAPGLALGAAVRAGFLARADATTARRAAAVAEAHPRLRPLLLGWQRAAHGRFVVPAACLVAVAVGRRPAWSVPTMLGAWCAGLAAKGLVRRPRPGGSRAPGSGYPSGHVLAGAAVSAALLLDLRDAVPRHVTGPLAAVLTAAVVVTAADRVLLRAHHLTDVVGGAVLGTGLVLGSAAACGPFAPSRSA